MYLLKMIKLNQLSVILIVILNISLINGLFEDQIGKFDWLVEINLISILRFDNDFFLQF